MIKISRRKFLSLVTLSTVVGLTACGNSISQSSATSVQSTAEPTALPSPQPTQQAEDITVVDNGEYRAMWISYLEWQQTDFSSQVAFTANIATMFDNCKTMGLNTVIVQVRPFGDAFYESKYYPWSHFITSTQGTAPSFDPLDIMVSEAHTRGLAIEAWINPYRLRLNNNMPNNLADSNLYYTNPEWVVEVGEGLYLNPALPETAQYVTNGVVEILENYAVDAIHFDDYFYPTTENYIDEEQFLLQSATQDLGTFRRAKVTELVKMVYDAIKAYNPKVRFGISPQGNPDNNYSQQYSDVSAWMNPAPGEECMDYVCPQVYWGYNFTLSSGTDRFAFENIVPEWLAMPKAQSVALYFGLGAWRIGDGDSGQNENSTTQWNTGDNLAQMLTDLREQNSQGFILYRYGSLYSSAHPEVAAQEVENLTAIINE